MLLVLLKTPDAQLLLDVSSRRFNGNGFNCTYWPVGFGVQSFGHLQNAGFACWPESLQSKVSSDLPTKFNIYCWGRGRSRDSFVIPQNN